MAWWRATTRAGLRLWVLSMIAAALALAPSPCSPIEPGAGQLLQAPTSGESAVQYAALTAKQNSSECARVDPAALRWLLVHVTFDSTLESRRSNWSSTDLVAPNVVGVYNSPPNPRALRSTPDGLCRSLYKRACRQITYRAVLSQLSCPRLGPSVRR
jgi:hypothetical protein